MKIRGIRWAFIYAWLMVLSFLAVCHAGSPLFTHQQIDAPSGVTDDQKQQYDKASTMREFTEIYSRMADRATTPRLLVGAGAPSFSPGKFGDLFVSTTTGKVYIATATLTSLSWAVMN